MIGEHIIYTAVRKAEDGAQKTFQTNRLSRKGSSSCCLFGFASRVNFYGTPPVFPYTSEEVKAADHASSLEAGSVSSDLGSPMFNSPTRKYGMRGSCGKHQNLSSPQSAICSSQK